VVVDDVDVVRVERWDVGSVDVSGHLHGNADGGVGFDSSHGGRVDAEVGAREVDGSRAVSRQVGHRGGLLIDFIIEGEGENELSAVGHRLPLIASDIDVEFSGGVFGSIDGSHGNVGFQANGIKMGVRVGFSRDGKGLGVVGECTRGDHPAVLWFDIRICNKVVVGSIFDFPESNESNFVNEGIIVVLMVLPLRRPEDDLSRDDEIGGIHGDAVIRFHEAQTEEEGEQEKDLTKHRSFSLDVVLFVKKNEKKK